MAPLMEVRNATKVFHVGSAKVQALDDVSLTVQSGQSIAIVGESGSGKTTLANLILGIEQPTSGEILMDGRPLPFPRTLTDRRTLSLVQQNPYSTLNPRKSIGQSLTMPLDIHRIGSRADRRKKVFDALATVGLAPDLYYRRPLSMSGGQRQRVAIARALLTNPHMLVLDEPTSALDVSVQANILNLLDTIRNDLGLTYVFITHDLGVVRIISDYIYIFYRGKIVERGLAENIFFRPKHRYTQLLLNSIPTVSPEDERIKAGWPEGFMQANADQNRNGCLFRFRCPFAREQCAESRPQLVGDEQHQHACFNPNERDAEKLFSAKATA